MNLIGDVKGKVAVMVDDMIDTAGWLYILLLMFTYKETISATKFCNLMKIICYNLLLEPFSTQSIMNIVIEAR